MKKIKVKNSKMTFRKEVEVNKTKSKKMEKSIY